MTVCLYIYLNENTTLVRFFLISFVYQVSTCEVEKGATIDRRHYYYFLDFPSYVFESTTARGIDNYVHSTRRLIQIVCPGVRLSESTPLLHSRKLLPIAYGLYFTQLFFFCILFLLCGF